MTPLRFEEQYQAEWDELQALLPRLRNHRRRPDTVIDPERVARLYRQVCGHLALARERAYPAYLIQRLEQITGDAHQVIYQQKDLGLARLRRLLNVEFPRAVRAHARYVWIAAAVFVLPNLTLGVLVYFHPGLILSVMDAQLVAELDRMYSTASDTLGRLGGAQTDWQMFGFYIRNNIGIAFQCFAGGLFAGIGSLFFLAYNGAFAGAVAGYVTQRGLGPAFYSFVVTHSAFELTAIVLAGAAGLRIGHALLAPGRLTRMQALVLAAKQAVVIVYGVALLLLIAAAVEAFWSSANWLPLSLKYAVAALCWAVVVAYLTLQGRHAG